MMARPSPLSLTATRANASTARTIWFITPMATFTSLIRLMVWRKGQTTIVLTRSEPLVIDVLCKDFVTADSLTANVSIRTTVQISDVLNFLTNLLGPRESFTCDELRERATPLIQRSVWECVSRRTMPQMMNSVVAHEISKQIDNSISLSLKRYGLQKMLEQMKAQR